MTDLGPVAWPPAPIRTARLVLRESEARDRTAFVELLASPEVNTYLAGRVTNSSATFPSDGPGASWSSSTGR